MARGGKRANAGRKRVSDPTIGEKQSKSAGGLGELQTDLLQARTHVQSDLRLLSRAVREGWEIPKEKRGTIVGRLLKVVEKEEVAVMTKEGIETLDGPADVTAVGAARVLVAMDAINQTDFWNQDKNDRLDAGKSTENVALQAPPINRIALPAHLAERMTN